MVGFAHQRKEIPPSAVDAGIQIFKLIMEDNWLQGRGMDKVVPMCLFTACRRETRCKVMLMDFAELSHVSTACFIFTPSPGVCCLLCPLANIV